MRCFIAVSNAFGLVFAPPKHACTYTSMQAHFNAVQQHTAQLRADALLIAPKCCFSQSSLRSVRTSTHSISSSRWPVLGCTGRAVLSRQIIHVPRRLVSAKANRLRGHNTTMAALRFDGPGPYRPTTLPVVNLPLGMSPSGSPINLQLEVTHPEGKRSAPLAVISAGFLLNSALYRSYAARLASWGWAVALWDLSELQDDTITVAYMRQVLDCCATDRRLAPYVDASKAYLIGHSRGAKLSCLMAAQDPRVSALCLIDPVDSSNMGPSGIGYPSSLPALRDAITRRGGALPTLIVGAGQGGDIVPLDANWRRFVDAAVGARAPVWELVLKEAGHLQFLDKQIGLFSLFSAPGAATDEVVGRVTKAAMVAWAQLAALPSSDTTPPMASQQLSQEANGLKLLAQLDSRTFNGMQAAGSTSSSYSSGTSNGASSGRGAGQQQQQQRQQSWSNSAGSSAWGRDAAASPAPPPPPPPPPPRPPAVTLSLEQLLTLPARDLKRMLQERGISSADCFEKGDLARKVAERCT